MRKKFIFIVCIGFFVIFLFSPLKAVNNYSSTEYGYTQMDETFGIPRVITSINNDDFSGSEEEIAQQYLSYNSYYLFQTLTPEIEITKSITNPAGTHIRFHQEENNIPVIDSGIIISLNNKKEITMLVNNYKPEISVSTSPSVTLKQAIQIARNSFENSEFDTAIPIEGELSIYVESDETYYLVWKLNIILLDFTDWYILVNALNGDILKKKNITVNAYGNVFDPDPGTYFEDYTLPDSSDADYSDLSDAYQYEELNDLNASVGVVLYTRKICTFN